MFPFYNSFKVLYNICQGCKLIERKKNTNLSSMNKNCEKNQQHIVKIFYMWVLCITLKERNTKWLVQNWHSPKSPSTEWS